MKRRVGTGGGKMRQRRGEGGGGDTRGRNKKPGCKCTAVRNSTEYYSTRVQ